MAAPAPFPLEKLVFGLLLAPGGELSAVVDALGERFGELDYRSRPLAFDFTSYYSEEMGAPLTRYFLSAARLRAPDQLATIKLETNAIERELSADGSRSANIDPGMLSESRFILATAKRFSHRIPLAHGIYGEVTLIYEKKDYRPQPWTYPDYASRAYRDVLCTIRELYRSQINQSRKT